MKIAAITGGAGALGTALARELVDNGYKVALFDLSKEAVEARASELGKDNAFGYASDFASAEAWATAFEATKKALGGIPTHAALIAGSWDGGAAVHETKDEASY